MPSSVNTNCAIYLHDDDDNDNSSSNRQRATKRRHSIGNVSHNSRGVQTEIPRRCPRNSNESSMNLRENRRQLYVAFRNHPSGGQVNLTVRRTNESFPNSPFSSSSNEENSNELNHLISRSLNQIPSNGQIHDHPTIVRRHNMTATSSCRVNVSGRPARLTLTMRPRRNLYHDPNHLRNLIIDTARNFISREYFEEMLQSALSSGLNDETIEHHTLSYSYRQASVNTSESKRQAVSESCPICLEEFSVNVNVLRLPCIHLFHSTCIKRWLRKNRRCPVCRTNVIQSSNNHL